MLLLPVIPSRPRAARMEPLPGERVEKEQAPRAGLPGAGAEDEAVLSSWALLGVQQLQTPCQLFSTRTASGR